MSSVFESELNHFTDVISLVTAPGRDVLKAIANSLRQDLNPGADRGRFFSEEVWQDIEKRAALELMGRLQAASQLESQSLETKQVIEAHQIRSAWQAVAEDFHRTQFWSIEPQKSAPIKKKTMSVERELGSYIWTFIQAAILTKIAVYFFGLKMAEDPSTENLLWLVAAISFSFLSLALFAWRKTRAERSAD